MTGANTFGRRRQLCPPCRNPAVVAIDELFPEPAVGEVFADFAAHFPHVELELMFPTMEDAGRFVLDGKADLGVMATGNPTARTGLSTIGWVPLQLVCGRDHPLAQGPIGWEELKRHRQIMVAARSEARKAAPAAAADVWWPELPGDPANLAPQCRLGADPAPHHRGLAPGHPNWRCRRWNRQGDWPVALELVWHKQRPVGPAATWLRGRLAATRALPEPAIAIYLYGSMV